MIPIQYALRRRMMGSYTRKWTLEITSVAKYVTVSIDGNELKAGTYVVDDGTIVNFQANGLEAFIKVNGKNVSTGVLGSPATYNLELHSNCTAIGTTNGMSGIWEITTQQ